MTIYDVTFQRFDKFDIAAASLFLAAKVEETPRKLQHVIFILYEMMHQRKLDDKSDEYKKRADLLVEHEVRAFTCIVHVGTCDVKVM